MESFESERREFLRIPTELPVRYRFFCESLADPDLGAPGEGSTRNLSGGGLLLRARIGKLEWLPFLLGGRMQVGVSFDLPGEGKRIRALSRVAWIEGLNADSGEASLGLVFREITRESQDDILRYVIQSKLPE